MSAVARRSGLDLAIGRNATLGVSYVGQIASRTTPRRASSAGSFDLNRALAHRNSEFPRSRK